MGNSWEIPFPLHLASSGTPKPRNINIFRTLMTSAHTSVTLEGILSFRGPWCVHSHSVTFRITYCTVRSGIFSTRAFFPCHVIHVPWGCSWGSPNAILVLYTLQHRALGHPSIRRVVLTCRAGQGLEYVPSDDLW